MQNLTLEYTPGTPSVPHSRGPKLTTPRIFLAGKRRPSAGSGDNVEVGFLSIQVGGSIKGLVVFIGCNKYQFYDKLTLDGGIARQLCLLKAFKGVVRSSWSITVRVCQICCTAWYMNLREQLRMVRDARRSVQTLILSKAVFTGSRHFYVFLPGPKGE